MIILMKPKLPQSILEVNPPLLKMRRAVVQAEERLQEVERRFFAIQDLDARLAWICGQMPKEEFMTTATFFRRGQLDTENGYRVHADCFNMRIDHLHPVISPNPW